jgi:hypothetical protein
LQSMGGLAAENYSSLPLYGSNKRLQLWRQDLKSINMAASEDDRGTAVAEALGGKVHSRRAASKVAFGGGRKRLQRGHGRSTLGGGRKRSQWGRRGCWR